MYVCSSGLLKLLNFKSLKKQSIKNFTKQVPKASLEADWCDWDTLQKKRLKKT